MYMAYLLHLPILILFKAVVQLCENLIFLSISKLFNVCMCEFYQINSRYICILEVMSETYSIK